MSTTLLTATTANSGTGSQCDTNLLTAPLRVTMSISCTGPTAIPVANQPNSTVTIEHSSDASVWRTLESQSFGSGSGPFPPAGQVRMILSAYERYLRVVWHTRIAGGRANRERPAMLDAGGNEINLGLKLSATID
jgi:hypothetical protein